MFSSTPQSLRQEVQAALASAREGRAEFLALPADAGLSQVALALDRIGRALENEAPPVGSITSLHPDQAMRDEAEKLEQEISDFQTELSLDRRVYDRLAGMELGDDEDPLERRLVQHALRDYRRSGVDRDEEGRDRIRALKEELVEIGQTFDRNILMGGRELRLEEGHGALAGLPADYLAAHPEAGDGSVTLSTDPPDFLPFMLYAERSDLRREYMLEYQNRAYPENLEVLDRLLEKRHELATQLGYKSWAEYITEDKMVQNASAARGFIERVSGLARGRASVEYVELLEEKRKADPEAEVVHEWERSYLVEQVKQARFQFDSQSVRPYFAYENVKQGVLDISAQLYGVEFQRVEDGSCWHDDVECYEIREGGEVIARFYLDMFPREGKFKHAAMFHLTNGVMGETLPQAALGCNFPRPTADDSALMLHTQVTTFFHEFGHLLHHLFGGQQRFCSMSGIATEWDFVEVPSQMYEEWAWDPGVLHSFARHHETEEPIPAEMVARLRAGEEYGKGIQVAVQMYYAMLSLVFYEGDPADLDTTEVLASLRSDLTPFEHVPGTHFHASFGHLHGYSAIYYTYMWSLVISKDLFSSFGPDLMDRARAGEYRAKVLAPGGSSDAADLVRSFLGREYRTDAWEAWLAR